MIIAIALYFIMENRLGNLAFADKWTFVMILLFAIEAAFTLVKVKGEKESK